ncbi:MAG TPA: SMR family transporter [Candidatus Binataceae bacterium]|nr:SMR family transporter [Candidatus Binataceae bacterium]
MDLILLLIAATLYATGGLLMKYSAGLSNLRPTIAFLGLFVCGALLQGRAMRSADLGMAYVLVLGIEAAMTIIFSALILRETFTTARIIALCMVIAGSALLSQT